MKKFFAKLFGRFEHPEQLKQTQPFSQSQNATTAPLTDAQIMSIVNQNGLHYEPHQLSVGCGQSVGRQRDLNEDSLLAFTSTVSGNFGSLPMGLFIVADGMGGHQYGEVASNAAMRVLGGYIMRKFHSMLFGHPAQAPDESIQEIMLGGINEAQRVVQREAPGSGTTLTAALVLGQQITIAHVGDSRAYMFHQDGRSEVLTRDHSLVKRLEELGQLTSEEASVHPQRNVLYRALGQGDLLEPDIITIPFQPGSQLLLCSDGLWGVVPEETLLRSIRETPTLQRACHAMVEAANLAGGPDNISAVLVQLLS